MLINKYAKVDTDESITMKTYVRAYAQQTLNTRNVICAYPFLEKLEHIAQKHKRIKSPISRTDFPGGVTQELAEREKRSKLVR